MGFKISGTVYKVGETKQLGANGFTKREIVVETLDNPKYPQLVALELAKDRCSLGDDLNVGDTVDVEFDIRGREWRSGSGEVKFFTTLSIWKLSVTNKAAPASKPIVADDQSDIPF